MTWNWENGLELRRPYRLRSTLCQATGSTAIGCREHEGKTMRGEVRSVPKPEQGNASKSLDGPSQPKTG
jgi:hypothetical protein